MEEFHRIRRLPPYVFEQVNRAKAVARNAGADIVDLGMGNPDLPTPAHVIEKLKDPVRGRPTVSLSFSMTWAGVGRSGLPMPRSTMSAPALRATALARFTCSNT